MNATIKQLVRLAVRVFQGGVVLLVVLAIFAMVFVPGLVCSPGKARLAAARTDVARISAALDLLRLDTGRYPTMQEGLAVLVVPTPQLEAEKRYKKGGYLDRQPVDPWGHPYHYKQPGDHNPASYDVWSDGSDNAPGGKGEAADIGNWVGANHDPEPGR